MSTPSSPLPSHTSPTSTTNHPHRRRRFSLPPWKVQFLIIFLTNALHFVMHLQSSSSSSALFLTAAAQNLLCVKLAEGLALVSLLVTPVILYKIFPPEMKDTPDAPLMARRRLEQMDPIKNDQWVMMIVMLVAAALWIAGEALGLASVVTAMLGLSLLLAFGILEWDDCLTENTLAWFGVLIDMATQLTTLGVVAWMSNAVANFLKSLSLHCIYSAFLGMCLASKVPGLFAALALGYNTNIFGALTHYSSGQAAVYYGAGYVELRNVFKLGIIIALINIVIWGLVGVAKKFRATDEPGL
ncbi:hypothetical protein RND71_025254 [Anisodus tanguticus]|uniref:Uncharacterized protein n=1 Tax=Anisodus tanguticus TaxID=243964 RepID=A0AAE1RSP5_9SOLA|nr:hypothetical protein RND71_025254 [Anisodus tanguticus]